MEGKKRKETGPQATGRGRDSRETSEVALQEACLHFRGACAPCLPRGLTCYSRVSIMHAGGEGYGSTGHAKQRIARTQITTQEAQLEKPL